MNVVVFEDAAVDRLGVLVAARPACDLTIGCHTLAGALGHLGHVHRAVRPHLARYLADLAAARITAWGSQPESAALEPAASQHGAVTLFVNARLVPSRHAVVTLRSLVEKGRPCLVRSGTAIAAALVHVGADGITPDHTRLSALDLPEADAALALPDGPALALLDEPHDIITAHEAVIEDALAWRIDEGSFREVRPGLFAAADTHIADPVVVRRGPVVVERGAEIGPFVCLDGPVWIGPEARVNPHAWIRGATAIGRGCRIGGEVEASVLEPFSNKAHDGFLGHSHVGSWANLAAGTITGNLKATYGPVRLHVPRPDGSRETVHTGRQFLGAFIADFVKTAINSALPCGCRIGVAAMVGGDVPEIVPAFHAMLIGGAAGGRSTPDQVATILERMMARRGLQLLPADRELLETLAG
jgi:UDP-N-acetylglucosamine diphosphorylase/glucosamine-1-phosphate N-acetyltransferase